MHSCWLIWQSFQESFLHKKWVYLKFDVGQQRAILKSWSWRWRCFVLFCFPRSLWKAITKPWNTSSTREGTNFLTWLPVSSHGRNFGRLLRASVSASRAYLQILLFCLSRLNSIDVKYQMWKLGVVFTDNVSPLLFPQCILHSH